MSDRIWFGIYGKEYSGDEPAFFDDDFVWKRVLADGYEVIMSELSVLMEDDRGLRPYFDESIQFPPKHWKALAFSLWGKPNRQVAQQFPRLVQLFEQIPGLVSASISLLEPHAHILPHVGETNAVFRVHLGLSIPAGLPLCGFKVKEEMRPWQEGGVLVFLDAFRHEAFNDTDEKRYVLILDIVRPEFMKDQKQICIISLSVLSLYWLVAHLPSFIVPRREKEAAAFPSWFVSMLLLPFKLFWYLYWPFLRR